MVFKVGLTGGIASGKTTVSSIFNRLGVDIIDADLIARHLLDKGEKSYLEVVEHFGKQVLLDNGDINRSWLRQQIFSNPTDKVVLEAILHPRVRELMLSAAAECQHTYCILSIPLLAEAGMQDMVDRVVVVDINPSTQLSRLMARDQLSEQQALQMLNNQANREQRLSIADDIIDNNGPLQALEKQIEKLHQHYLKLATTDQ